MKLNRIFVVVLFAVLPFFVAAQEDLNKTVQVTRAYDPIISDAEKIELPVSVSDTLLNIKGGYKYSIKPQSIVSNLALRPMPAAKINENAYKDPKWFYARLGAGYPLQFLGDIYMQNLKPEDISYGLFYNHRSIWSKIDNPNGENIPIDELNHQGGIFFRKNWEKMTFNINGGFNQHNVLFYGYNTGAAKLANHKVDKDSIRQSYTSFNISAGINSLDVKESVFRYDINMMFDAFGDNGKKKFDDGRIFAMRENKFGADVKLGAGINEGVHLFTLNTNVDVYMRDLKYNQLYNMYFPNSEQIYNQLYNDLYGIYGTGRDSSDTKYIFNVNPSYKLTADKVELELGVKYTGYKKLYDMKHKVYPVANVQWNLANEFAPFAGINGGIMMNDYKSISSENPFITPGMNMAMKASNCSYAITAGAKGNIENIFSYNIYGRYSQIKDYYFFVNSTQTLLSDDPQSGLVALENNFDVVYDDVQQLEIGAEMKLAVGPVHASLTTAYYSYKLDVLEEPFHRPSFVADFNIDVNAGRYLILNLNMHARSKTPYLYSQALRKTEKNDAIFDMGLGAEYMFNRSFSVFVNVNNIFNKKYEYWHGYKVPGIGAIGGITFKF